MGKLTYNLVDMIFVVTQDRKNAYLIRYFHLNKDEETGVYEMVGFDDKTHNLVSLGIYNFYKQAIDVFAKMDYEDNDIMYYKPNNKLFEMPYNITDERECIQIYGSTY